MTRTMEEIRQFLAATCAVKDPLLQKLRAVGAITAALEADGIRPIVIGGTAVAFYTLGGYATEDVDLAVVGRDRFAEVLAELGFVRSGRFWSYEELPFALESPAGALPGEDAPLTIVAVDGYTVSILGIEDLILDRLNALVHWKSSVDGEWVHRLLEGHKADIDREYLDRRAAALGTRDALQQLFAKVDNENA